MFGLTPEQCYTLAAICQGEGMPVSRALTEYHIIKGKPTLKAEAALSRFQRSGGAIRWTERTETAAEAVFSHPQGGEVTIRWTMEDAKRAGLTGNDTWRKFPRQMLHARTVAEGVRACYPACLGGLPLDAEREHIDTAPAGTITIQATTRPELTVAPPDYAADARRVLADHGIVDDDADMMMEQMHGDLQPGKNAAALAEFFALGCRLPAEKWQAALKFACTEPDGSMCHPSDADVARIRVGIARIQKTLKSLEAT